jgi:hypothetical protein
MDDATLLRRNLADIGPSSEPATPLMDQKKWDEWAMVFSTDAHLVVPEGAVDERGRAAVVASVSGVLEGVRTVHHGHMPEIEITGPDTARGIWAMFDYVEFPAGPGGERIGLQGYGHYTEEYLRETRWRIASLHLCAAHRPLGGGCPSAPRRRGGAAPS